MKNYEAIQKMNLKQMAYTFYLFLKPFLKDGTSEAELKMVYGEIEQFLEREIPENAKAGERKY